MTSRGADPSTIASVPPPRSPDGAVVWVTSGAAKGRSVRLPPDVGTAISIGKAEGNDLVLNDPSVSRNHVVIRRTAAGFELEDQGSTNGTTIGGARVRSALLDAGTAFNVGDVELVVGVELGNVVIPPSDEQRFGIAVGKSLPMRRIFGVLERIARTRASVLLTGETGTGKDVIARSVHTRSQRESGPFEVVDCGAVAPSLIESELFGHERGSFTGAVAARAGAFERAAGGTLFLDEIGELALDLQPKLLRVLEARQFRRVGGNKTLDADVRIIAATTRDLAREVERGAFREDLYFRLAVVSIEVPPLRARLDDIPLLVTRILASMPSELAVEKGLLADLRRYDWPGNVRELRNVIERAAHFSLAAENSALSLIDFPPARPPSSERELVRPDFGADASYRDTRARFEAAFEHQYVRWLLERHGGNVSAAARAARMDRNHLTDLARRHGLYRGRES